MSSYRETMPREAVYTGLDELDAQEHAMNAVGDPERGPRVVVNAPGLSVVVTADEARALAERLTLSAAYAEQEYNAALSGA